VALPVNGSTHLIPSLLLIYRPRKGERLSWPSCLTCSGRFTHISGHPSAAGRAQDRESSPARDRRSTSATVPRHQPSVVSSRPTILHSQCLSAQQHTASRLSHHSGFASTPLAASSSETSGVQDCMSGTPIDHVNSTDVPICPTFNSSPSTVVAISAHLPTEHSLFHAHVPLSATEVSLSQDRVCGTVYRLL